MAVVELTNKRKAKIFVLLLVIDGDLSLSPFICAYRKQKKLINRVTSFEHGMRDIS